MIQKQRNSVKPKLEHGFGHVQSMLIAASALVVMSLSACNNSSDNGPVQAAQPATPPVAQEAATTPPPPPPPAPPEFFVGDTSENGQLEITLNDVKTGTNMANAFEVKTASEGGQYVVVIVKEKNIGSKPISSFRMPSINLIDANGNKYSEDVDASITAAEIFGDNSKVLSDLNPGLATTSVKAFEVSKDAFNAAAWHLTVGDSFVYRLVARANTSAQSATVAPQQPAIAPTQPAAPQANAVEAQDQQPPAQAQAATTQPVDPATDLNTTPNQVYGTSFDCGKSHSQNEYLICHTAVLAAADVKLANAVAAAKSAIAPTDLDAFKDRMRGQWNFREKHCNDVACLSAWYTYQSSTMALIEQTRNVAARVDTPQS